VELSPVRAAVFDPDRGRYRSTSLGPFRLEVRPPPATPTPTVRPDAVDEPTAEIATGSDADDRRMPSWVPLLGALLLGLVTGGVAVALVGRRRAQRLPPPRPGQAPADRARELQVALERWWLDVRDRPAADDIRPELDELRRELEAVRFAPGRADHSHTVEDVELRMRRLMRRA
jgi:hypothetical protein